MKGANISRNGKGVPASYDFDSPQHLDVRSTRAGQKLHDCIGVGNVHLLRWWIPIVTNKHTTPRKVMLVRSKNDGPRQRLLRSKKRFSSSKLPAPHCVAKLLRRRDVDILQLSSASFCVMFSSGRGTIDMGKMMS